jgi:hypothetical protein
LRARVSVRASKGEKGARRTLARVERRETQALGRHAWYGAGGAWCGLTPAFHQIYASFAPALLQLRTRFTPGDVPGIGQRPLLFTVFTRDRRVRPPTRNRVLCGRHRAHDANREPGCCRRHGAATSPRASDKSPLEPSGVRVQRISVRCCFR